ncbi:DNA cytosine methyltransferase [Gordonia polyisoprenivorans]|uniref:DNA cytosine methyltransferase n=1 Tax=Gordonia polyisoprenivorans TaxID=84595 RepID=UPI0023004619|nr:DNA cytosine methyltransferase [Gordonia polyisoprenivorans]WCB39480.1 DNA cytosine methyltransferase [Gordonia polyisoprenivorans]
MNTLQLSIIRNFWVSVCQPGAEASEVLFNVLDRVGSQTQGHLIDIAVRGAGVARSDRRPASRGNLIAYPSTRPMRTRTTRETEAHVVTADDINECEFRMLEPSEIKRGMAFPAEYIMLGNRREQVKMGGNAVVPPAARDLVGAVVESLGAA